MTFNTNGYDIKRLRIVRMVIVLCLFSARAFKSAWVWQSARRNGVINNIIGFDFSRVTKSTLCTFASMFCFAFFAMAVLNLRLLDHGLISICLSILRNSIFAFFAIAVPFITSLTFFALAKLFLVSLVSCALIVCSLTILTTCLKSISRRTVFVIFRGRFYFFAMTASFCYDCLRHGFFLIKKLCLEPVARYTLAVGSLYYTIPPQNINTKISILKLNRKDE